MQSKSSIRYQRKWKFPRPLRTMNHRKREANLSYYVIILTLSMTFQWLLITNCNPIGQQQQEILSTKKPVTNTNDDCATSSSNDRKPSRLDANENELVNIDESLSAGSSSQPSEQIISPQVDRQVHPQPILNSETFQPNDLINLLDLQHQQQLNNQEQQLNVDNSFTDLTTNTKRRARSINQAFGASNEMLEAETDLPSEFSMDRPEQLDNSADDLDDNSSNDEPSSVELSNNNDVTIDPVQKEREAQASIQADIVNRMAMEDQQRKQNEIQTAQAQHVARAIEDQQAALNRQQDILMKQQLDEALNDSVNDREWRRSLSRGDSSQMRSMDGRDSSSDESGLAESNQSSDTIYFSDQSDSAQQTKSTDKSLGSADNEGNSSPAEASNWNENYDLAPAAQHHSYGSHYGALHKHQGKYYQSVESHKKGQYKSSFKRGNKKFTISGHASQDKGHASGHVKWHSKKGKGSHHWDLKHKDHHKKHHHHY